MQRNHKTGSEKKMKERNSNSDEQEKNPKKVKKIKPSIFTLALIAFGILIVFTAVGFSMDHVSRVNPNLCGLCHNMTDHVDSFLNQNHLDNVHYQANVGCKDCHSDYTVAQELSSLVSYISGNYSEPMDKIKVNDDMCFQCHIDHEHLAKSTDLLFRNPHQGHFAELRCRTCHVSHDKQVNYCGSCHDNGGQRMIEDQYYARSENPFAPGNVPNENAPKK